MRARAPPPLDRARLPSRAGRGAACGRGGRTRQRSSTAASTAPAARPRPGARARREGARRSDRPSSAISPANGTSRAIARRSVVFPAPFGPMSASHSPSATVGVDAVDDGPPAELHRHVRAARSRGAAPRRAQDEREERRTEERGHDSERDLGWRDAPCARRRPRARGSPRRRPPRAGAARGSRPR